MLEICETIPTVNYRELMHGTSVFHEALAHVLAGERRFTVVDEAGEALYDLAYTNNQAWAETSERYVRMKLFREAPLFPPYLSYDEDDAGRLCLDLLDGYDAVWFERASEYSVVLARILLAHTSKTIYVADERFDWFIEPHERVIAAGEAPAGTYPVFGDFVPATFDGDFGRIDAMTLFHHVFFFQWLTPLDLADIKYVEFLVPKTEGLGSILLAYGRGMAFFGAHGMQVTIRPGCTRYDDALLERYFRIPLTPEDADETNTVYVVNYYCVMYTKMLRRKGRLDLSVLQPSFLDDLTLYGDAVVGERRMLGVLLRGSDYVASAMGGASKPRGVDEVAPTIAAWLEEGGYDKIFLATEDADLLDGMMAAFPGRVICVAQERYRVSDFREGMTTISELDRARHPGNEYDEFIEDATVNYLYAIYLLSRCEAFMYSCHCGGVSLARQFNDDKFKRLYSFADAKEESA